MPFFLTNENIEASLERYPDDIFNPSDIEHKPSSRNTKIREIISKEIVNTFENYTKKTVVNKSLFKDIASIKEDKYFKYLLSFETNNDYYEIVYLVSSELADILQQYNQGEMFLSLSNLIISSLNNQEFSFLQDIEFLDLSNQTIDYNKTETLDNLYSFSIFIDKKEYEFYLQLDNQFNKIF